MSGRCNTLVQSQAEKSLLEQTPWVFVSSSANQADDVPLKSPGMTTSAEQRLILENVDSRELIKDSISATEDLGDGSSIRQE